MTPESVDKTRYWHPFLLAIYPVAALYAANTEATQLSDLLLPTVTALVLSLICLVIFRQLLPNSEKAAVATSWSIGCLFSYGLLYKGITYIKHTITGNAFMNFPHEYSLIVWGLIGLAGLVLIVKTKLELDGTNRFLNTMSAILLLITCLSGASGYFKAHFGAAEGDSDDQQLTEFAIKETEPLRDIYYLVFDRYASSQLLQENYDYDNSDFLQALRNRGFQVFEKSRANYPRTILSMASALNCRYLTDEHRSQLHYAKMLQSHAVGRALKGMGYKYFHFGNWFQPLRTNQDADFVYPTSVFPSEFSESLYKTTPFSKILRFWDKYTYVKNKFKQLAEVSEDPGLKFVYGHFLVPHPPYVLSSDGSRLQWKEARYSSPKKSYIGQLEATNELILETLDNILSSSAETPVIVLIADEGPLLTSEDFELDEKSKILKRASILNACLFPGQGHEEVIPQSTTPINTFRLIFNRYFDAGLKILPDRSFYWEEADAWGRPKKANKRFIDVTSLISE